VAGLRDRRAARAAESAERFAAQAQYREGHSVDQRAMEDIRADLQHASSFRSAASSRLDEARQYQESERKLQAFMKTGSIANNNAFYEFAAREGKHPQNPNITRKQWFDVLHRFLSQGEIARDDDGEFFMPQVGQGPNVMQNVNPEAMRAEYSRSDPGGGRQHVLDDAHTRRDEVVRAQRASGVSPTMHVDGTELKNQVAEGRDRVAGRVASAEQSAKSNMAGMQMSSDGAFANAPGQAGTFLHSIATDAEGNGIGAHATSIGATNRQRPGKQELDEWKEQRKTSNSEIPTK
jgi:hypothetical protein